MKPEELFFSLDQVGEDLIGAAEQNILVRKRRPWLGAAAAALLIAAVGAGGFFLWRQLGRSGPIEAASPSASVESSAVSRPEPDRALPMLEVAGNCPERDRRLVADLAGLPEPDLTGLGRLDSLPVYRRAAEDEAVQTEEALLALAGQALERLGVGPAKDFEFTRAEAGEGRVSSLKAGTALGTLTVGPDGQILLLFDEASRPESHAKLDFVAGTTEAQRKAAYYEAWQEDLAGQAAELLGLEGWRLEPCTDWNPALSSYHSFYLYPVRENPEQQLISRYFERVTLLTVSGNELRGLSWYEPLETEDGVDPTLPNPGLTCLGSYPVISPEHAEYVLLSGCALGGNLPGGQDLACTAPERTELVYLPDENCALLMPFYRFWYPSAAGETGPLAEYTLLYVPAVLDVYLSDWAFPDTQPITQTHPKLFIGDFVRSEEYLILEDPAAYAASNPWQAYGRVNLREVYRAPAAKAPSVSPRTMAATLMRYAELMGLTVTQGPDWAHCGGQVSDFLAETDQGTLWVSSDGTAALEYDEAHRFTPKLDPGLSEEEAEAALIDAFALHLSDPDGETRPEGRWQWRRVEGRAPALESLSLVSSQLCSVAEVYADNGSYDFGRIRLYYQGQTLRGFRLGGPRPDYTLPFALLDGSKTEDINALITDDSVLQRLGGYPIIPPEEARALYAQGSFLPGTPGSGEQRWVVGFSGGAGDPAEDPVELVYCVNATGEYLFPCYRFLHPVGTDGAGNTACLACYVPAVNGLFLEDWPPSELPTEPAEPDGELPRLVTGSDGRPEIEGPAGRVPALSYMGFPEQEPVWADPDGDGQWELVYWCHGPTSGLFTAGICVYGLEEGWPVLEAAQFYSLTWGELRLTAEGGKVFLHYTPQRYDPAAGSTVPQAEQLCSVTVEDGQLLLNGGALPEGCEAWGGPEWAWFGRSFAAMKAEAMQVGVLSDMPRVPVYGSSCVVWLPLSASSVPTAGQRVFAAVTENGVTVTGLLRWEPRQDGTYFCAMQGVEAIEAPEPAELPGLSAEALTERFGPRHFETDDPTPRLCWFTEDCRLLTVSLADGLVTEATLTALYPQAAP